MYLLLYSRQCIVKPSYESKYLYTYKYSVLLSKLFLASNKINIVEVILFGFLEKIIDFRFYCVARRHCRTVYFNF